LAFLNGVLDRPEGGRWRVITLHLLLSGSFFLIRKRFVYFISSLNGYIDSLRWIPMALIDEQYLKDPTCGSRRMTVHLRRKGYKVNRKSSSEGFSKTIA